MKTVLLAFLLCNFILFYFGDHGFTQLRHDVKYSFFFFFFFIKHLFTKHNLQNLSLGDLCAEHS